MYALVYRPLRSDLAAAQMTLVSQQVEAKVLTLVHRVEAIARTNAAWGRRGMIVEHAERNDALLAPVIENRPRHSLDGRRQRLRPRVLLARLPGGGWVA